ncbi:hypothetical protein C7H19_07750 [Aphanothece hegewaldii CCALA 016]|uniref:Bacterial surface antigen (D15) domain-containing protein n=1 Tax=Aphanothece hegewaldii CCALA 016 TaxID=2107694 RepID=A0A2T1LZM3_9CHRO|nr:BamA/TamA family outer membrane protein [Aphanothece hegewaldii]PSF37868.1 hypothetical protein C7H19_07750 [Aphanothece hegewaldii CCALA 016]
MFFKKALFLYIYLVLNLIGTAPSWGQTRDENEPETPSCTTADCLKPTEVTPEQPTNNRREIILPNPTQFRLSVFGNQKKGDFTFGFGRTLPNNSALKGSSRIPVVSTLQNYPSISPQGFVGYRLAENQRIVLEGGGNTKFLGGDLSYSIAPIDSQGIYSINIQSQRGRSTVFGEGENNIRLPNDDKTWVYRYGGGVEYAQLINNINLAVGINYERISLRDGMFSNQVFSRDQFGNQMTVSDQGQDDLVTLTLAGLYSIVNNESYPTSGTRIRVGVEQALPIGQGSIAYTQLAGNISQFIPLNLFDNSESSDTLVLNMQAGTYIGDVPPYDAFSMGGSDSIRGYSEGQVSSGRTFIQGTVEYRSPSLFSFSIFEQTVDTRGIIFVDYGTDLGSQYSVISQPGIVRDKPGWGVGYGFGLHLDTTIGLFRVESSWGNRGDYSFVVLVGDRF